MVTARFGTKRLPSERDDAGRVGRKCLLKLKGQSTAHFELGPSQTSCAIMHGTLEGIWFFICGGEEIWREQDLEAKVVEV